MRRTHRARVSRAALLLLTLCALAAPAASGAPGVLTGLARTGHLHVCYIARRQGPSVNRVSRLRLRGAATREARVLLDDIPAANIHDGCRGKFGPDGKLYVATGDAARPQDSQNPRVLSGKILRLNADGSVPGDNRFHGSPVWPIGHRNVVAGPDGALDVSTRPATAAGRRSPTTAACCA